MSCPSTYVHYLDWSPTEIDPWRGDQGVDRCVREVRHELPHRNEDGDEWTDDADSFRFVIQS